MKLILLVLLAYAFGGAIGLIVGHHQDPWWLPGIPIVLAFVATGYRQRLLGWVNR